ncbi:MAG: acyl-CoA dehydrogenase family protein [Dehalococcoidales bacterium]|nr:acyl-CoA dehydrogenase family protein [Dehalococcoidales bacterium]
MDFEFHFNKELEDFRREVRNFIEENAYKERTVPTDRLKMTPEMYRRGRELQRKAGAKGWFAPAYPKEYGGGGLDIEKCVILAQEFENIKEEGRWPALYTEISGIYTGGIWAHGTEEQKRRFMPKILTAEWEGWQCFTEPEAGSDEASMQSTAVRDGDVYVINGTKLYVGHNIPPVLPEYLYWPAITDPKAPRHQNLSAFFIPADLPGIQYEPLDLTASDVCHKWQVICKDVRCPTDRLIGEINKGWMVTQATLALEHGGGGAVVPPKGIVLKMIEYCKKTKHNGQPLSKDPIIQDILVQLYIEYNAGRLWGLRNFAMSQGQIPTVPYTGTQTSLQGKRFAPQLGKALLDILGTYGLIYDPEVRVIEGEVEQEILAGDITHPGGTPEVQQIIMARALGLGRGRKAK